MCDLRLGKKGGFVMRVSMFGSSFVFLLLLMSGQVMLVEKAYAGKSCCGCSCNSLWCYCPGQGGCAWYPCHSTESPTLQAQALTNNESLDITGSYSSLPSPSPRSYSVDRLIARATSDQCDKKELARKFFHSAEDRLMFAEDLLSYENSSDKNSDVLANQMASK
jgi:hypothetical protein